jgi:hypothetical protein
MRSCSPSPAQKAAAREILRRRSARATLLDFTRYTFPNYQAEPAHALIAQKLDALVRGEIQRLMIFAPPQHGKSELASVRLPAFWLGRRPDDPVILASYVASLAESKSRQARQVVESPEYERLFPGIVTQRDSRSVAHWTLEGHRGYLLAAGVGGPITGHGARLGIIDDPLQNWQEAQSQTVRDTCWEWWRSTFRTRIWGDGAIVIIMTRWHEDDLAGRVMWCQSGRYPGLSSGISLIVGKPGSDAHLADKRLSDYRKNQEVRNFSASSRDNDPGHPESHQGRDRDPRGPGRVRQNIPREQPGAIFGREYIGRLPGSGAARATP